EAVHLRHPHIEHDEVGMLARGDLQRIRARLAEEKIIAAPAQAELGQPPHVRFIVHDENLFVAHGWFASGVSATMRKVTSSAAALPSWKLETNDSSDAHVCPALSDSRAVPSNQDVRR